jgi:hypothetical protein
MKVASQMNRSADAAKGASVGRGRVSVAYTTLRPRRGGPKHLLRRDRPPTHRQRASGPDLAPAPAGDGEFLGPGAIETARAGEIEPVRQAGEPVRQRQDGHRQVLA